MSTETATKSSDFPKFLTKIEAIETPPGPYMTKLQSLRTKNWSLYRGSFQSLYEHLRKFQIALGIIGICILIFVTAPGVVEGARTLYYEGWKSFTEGLQWKSLILYWIESSLWIGFTFVMDKRQIPANYVAVLLQRTFMHSHLSTPVQANSPETAYEMLVNQPGKFLDVHYDIVVTVSLLLLPLVFITSITSIDLSYCDTGCLMGTVLATTWTTVLFISAMAIQTIGLENHLALCNAWAYFCTVTTLFVMLHVFQRLWKTVNYKSNQTNKPRATLEILMFIISMSIGLQYIPTIHKQFSYRQLLTDDSLRNLMKTLLVPKVLFQYCSFNWYKSQVLHMSYWIYTTLISHDI